MMKNAFYVWHNSNANIICHNNSTPVCWSYLNLVLIISLIKIFFATYTCFWMNDNLHLTKKLLSWLVNDRSVFEESNLFPSSEKKRLCWMKYPSKLLLKLPYCISEDIFNNSMLVCWMSALVPSCVIYSS